MLITSHEKLQQLERVTLNFGAQSLNGSRIINCPHFSLAMTPQEREIF